ncbi:MAG: signal peptidase I [Bacteroidales bacterium]|nr:signal peptidase I [Lachnoclostridium sp.]MCM1385404.1 signal peptidase I [Lachnoclostridium sp.]MCM1464114.1 signal peptidase I [Bacteroidales bacterium]
MKNKILKELLNTGFYLLIVLVITYLICTFVGQRTQVQQSSMETTLSSGDQLIIDKLTYRFSKPKRFDIIIFPSKQEDGKYYIKRVIGMPGETVQIDDNGSIYINGEVLEESYGREIIKAQNVGIAAQPITLENDEYFVMGDNRNNSNDSRKESIGNVHREDIVGKAWLRIWPFSKFGLLGP